MSALDATGGIGETGSFEAGASVRRWLIWLAWAAVASVIGLAVWQVWFNYHVKAYSDPLNWLRFARNLGSEFSTSRFPVGYPLFLRVVLDLVGPYYVFLSNLPVLLLACYLAAKAIGREAAGQRARALAPVGAAAGFAVLVASDPYMLVYLANPYRDPLSYVYLFGSMLLLQVFLTRRPRRFSLLSFSGILFGAAYSVREPSILMAGPMGLYGILLWRQDRDFALWKALAVFCGCALLGAAPLIVQSLAQTGGALPPQMVSSNGVPSTGLYLGNLELLARNSVQALTIYGDMLRWATIPIALGVFYALVDRNLFVLSVVIPGGLLYGFFYLSYYTLVHRYYHVTALFATMVAAYGVVRLGGSLGSWLGRWPGRRPVWLPLAGPVAAVAAALALAGWQLWPRGQRPDDFRISRARAFAADVRAAMPRDTRPVVLCRRNWCELIEWFTGIESYQVPYFEDEPQPTRPDRLKRHVDELLAKGHQVFVFDFPHPDSEATDAGPLRELFDLAFVAKVPLGRSLPPAWGIGDVPLLETRPWTNRVVEALLRRPENPGGWVEVNAGRLWGPLSNRTHATLVIDGVTVTNRLLNGFSVFPLAESGASSGLLVRVESDGPLPADMRIAARGFDDELVYDFLYFATPDPTRVSGHGVTASDPVYRPHPTVMSDAVVRLTAPLPPPGMIRVMEAQFSSSKRDRFPPDMIEIRLGSRLLGTTVVERTATVCEFAVEVGPDAGQEFDVAIHRKPGCPGEPVAMVTWDDMPDAVFLRNIRFACVARRAATARVKVGLPGDRLYLRSGVWPAEMFPGGLPGRWTTGKVGAELPIERVEGDGVLSIEVLPGLRDPRAGPANLRVICNGERVTMNEASSDPSRGVSVFRGIVPRVRLGATNEIVIVSAPWSPRDFGLRDGRELGVVLHRLALETAPAAEKP